MRIQAAPVLDAAIKGMIVVPANLKLNYPELSEADIELAMKEQGLFSKSEEAMNGWANTL